MAEQRLEILSSRENLAGAVVLVAVFLTSFHSYLLFHSLSEFLAAVVGVALFLLAWNARAFLQGGYLLFLGVAYIFISLLHVLHAMSFKDMGVFHGHSADLPTQLWISARYLAALSFLAAPWFIQRQPRPALMGTALSAIFVLLVMSIFVWRVFPTCYVEGVGQTRFKIYSEYIIIALFLAALYHFYRRRSELPQPILLMICLSLICAAAGEAAFTMYVSVDGPANLLGHLFLIVSVFLVYRAMIQVGLRDPYSFLFRNLRESEEALRLSEETAMALLNATNESAILTDTKGTILAMNTTAARRLGVEVSRIIGHDLNALLPSNVGRHRSHFMEEAVATGQIQRFQDQRAGRDWDIVVYPVFGKEGRVDRIAIYGQDVTERKRTEEKLDSLARFPGENPNPVLRVGEQGTLLYANSSGEKLLRLLGHNLADSSGIPPALKELAAAAFGKGSVQLKEILAADRIYSLTLAPIAGKDYMNIYGMDITDRKRAEQALHSSMEFTQTVLNSLSAHVAILDDTGRIISTNVAWQAFYRANRKSGAPDTVGMNYLDVCDRARGEGSVEAAAVAAGIRAVMAGQEDEFTLSYACHAPQERRWFNLRVRRLVGSWSQRVVVVHENITALKLVEEELRDSGQRYHTLFERAGEAILVVGTESQQSGRILEANQMAEVLYGYARGEMTGLRVADLYPPEDTDPEAERMAHVLHGNWITGEVEHRRRDGSAIPLEFISGPVRVGGRTHILVFLRDITDRRRWEEQLQLTRSVFENTLEGVLITDSLGVVSMVNPAFSEITGYTPEEVIGQSPLILRADDLPSEMYQSLWEGLTKDGQWRGEIWNRRKNGEAYPEWVTIRRLTDGRGNVTNYIAVIHDISELRRGEERIRFQAYHDALTGLPNRVLFNDRLGQAIAHAEREQERLAVVFMDLDNFKRINDSLGHQVGDLLLQTVAKRLQSALRDSDTVSRLGGDEFTMILTDLKRTEDALDTASRIKDSLSRPMLIQGRELFITTSMGLTFYPDDARDGDSLLKNADMAMYRAKEEGRNNIQLFTPAMNTQAQRRLQWELQLRQAVEKDEFVVHYQPRVEVETGRVTAMEALVRWQRPGQGVLPPSEFIALAEETGLILPLGELVLRRACSDTQALRQGLRPDLRVSVNLSPRQFEQADLVKMIQGILEETGLPPDMLELEITEGAIMRNVDKALDKMASLAAAGVRLALDDFGTGYSSLGYLKKFSIAALKVDQSFVRDLDQDPNDAAIVQTIIAMGHALNLRVVAEGVETPAQLAFLRGHQCDEYQGYYFSKPVALEEIRDLLRKMA